MKDISEPLKVPPRPWWMTGLAAFCLTTVIFLVPRDLLVVETRDVEVWLGLEVHGVAALLTAPLHWAIFAVGAWGFWTQRPWVRPWAAGYVFYIALSHFIWNASSPNGYGWLSGLGQAFAISIPGILLLPPRTGGRSMSQVEPTNDDRAESGPVIPQIFPTFDPVRVRIPIVASEMTIWPGPKETFWEWVEGFPFELHPLAWDYMWISCDGNRVEIKPHYFDSTWDTFWTDGQGYVTANALGGLFPFTLGKEVDLLKGIVSTLEALPPLLVDSYPDDATKIQQIHGILKTRETPGQLPGVVEGVSSLRRLVSEFVWWRKLARIIRRSERGS